ncbi:MAG: tRNA uridine-5-carboxymethylaminomethyl(34) synthesis enzyme MnmG [Chitinophagales bacterium]|nr:tRNA uridine-5-carboxymethylaminomethyl(34) synthesis enzyme MnmG [Chitinophagales bacterium]
MIYPSYDVIVVGAGHAGSEAAAAAANMGSKVLLVTMNMEVIAKMSCNPAMGGVAKGQILREIDALGGYSAIVSDKTMIQFRMLNKSKGPAMWSPRVQSDRMMFSNEWRRMLEQTPNVDFWQEMVSEIIVEKGKCVGVKTQMGIEFKAKAVVLTNGTFLNGIIHIGEKKFGGGRAGERAATGLTAQLESLGFQSGRMKTGTPPRVDGRTLDYAKMEVQPGDDEIVGFSYKNIEKPDKQRPCHITYTNTEVHEILKTGFDRSPMFTGRIKGVGPRYCPSVEDKINRFADKERHQIFVEPEGWNTVEVYINGFSTSLPEDVQYKAMREIPGFENAKMFRPGYAIEYDYFPPTQLNTSLETKLIKGLFFAGQINGTTGYEEAGAQGIIAGINAHQYIQDNAPLILRRDEAYIGVLIDDLINKGTEEPYRMFTSRAEFRILLRQDNADIRLTEKSYQLGLADQDRYDRVKEKISQTNRIIELLNNTGVYPNDVNFYLNKIGSSELNQKIKLDKLISRPHISIAELIENVPKVESLVADYEHEFTEQAEINIKYGGYIEREKEMAVKMHNLENIKLPSKTDYRSIPSLSIEAREKLNKLKPTTLGQASRISGVSPADISVLMVFIGR